MARWATCITLFLASASLLLAQEPVPSANTTAVQIIEAFLSVSGWSTANIRNLSAEGTVTYGNQSQGFEIEIERGGKARSHLKGSNIVMVAGGSAGGYTVDNSGTRKRLSADENARNGASVLLPIFTILGDVGSLPVNADLYESESPANIQVSLTKLPQSATDNHNRQDGSHLTASFDPSTHLLTSICFNLSDKETPATKLEVVVEYSDWRRTGDVLLPYQVKESSGGQQDFLATFSSIDANVSMNEGDFE